MFPPRSGSVANNVTVDSGEIDMVFWKLNKLLLQPTVKPIQWTTLSKKIMSVSDQAESSPLEVRIRFHVVW